MSRDHFAGCEDRGADGDHLYRTPAPDGAPTSAEIVANAADFSAPATHADGTHVELMPPIHVEQLTRDQLAEVAFGGDPFDALRSIELRDPSPRINLRDPLGVIADPYASWLLSRCMAPSPSAEAIVCILNAGHDGAHRSNPIPAMEWNR